MGRYRWAAEAQDQARIWETSGSMVFREERKRQGWREERDGERKTEENRPRKENREKSQTGKKRGVKELSSPKLPVSSFLPGCLAGPPSSGAEGDEDPGPWGEGGMG